MQRNKFWIALMVFGIMLITTVCYLTLRGNSTKQYADGKMVQVDDPDYKEITVMRFEWK